MKILDLIDHASIVQTADHQIQMAEAYWVTFCCWIL